MHISEAGKDLIKEFEGCRLKAYDDGVGVQTIGWGRTTNVSPGDTCTQEQADAWFDAEVEEFANYISLALQVAVSQNEFDAMVSLAYNIGTTAFVRSTLLKKLNARDFKGAAEQFDRWNQAGGSPMAGLTRRRAAERKLFEKPYTQNFA